MRIIRALNLLLISIFFMIAKVVAQDQLPMHGPAAERIAQYKKLRLMEVVQMNEETSVRFFCTLQQTRGEYTRYRDGTK